MKILCVHGVDTDEVYANPELWHEHWQVAISAGLGTGGYTGKVTAAPVNYNFLFAPTPADRGRDWLPEDEFSKSMQMLASGVLKKKPAIRSAGTKGEQQPDPAETQSTIDFLR
jgi:hypothetical protein